MRYPDFFIIGAMKAGTTTLYDDLSKHPNIFLPDWKEPGYFVGPDFGGKSSGVYPLASRDQYASLYQKAPSNALCGDGSTYYTKRPTYEGAADRILKACGPRTRIIYVLRDPVSRCKSQFVHQVQLGEASTTSFRNALSTMPEIIAYSRYDWQLKPFVDAFGARNILVLRFEDYASKREETVAQVLAFLELSSLSFTTNGMAIKNSANDRRRPNPLSRWILSQPLYHSVVRPLLPESLVARLRRLLTQPAPVPHIDMSDAEIADVLSQHLSAADFKLWHGGQVV